MRYTLYIIVALLLLSPIAIGCYFCHQQQQEISKVKLQEKDKNVVKLENIIPSPTITHFPKNDDIGEIDLQTTTTEEDIESDSEMDTIGLDIDQIPMFTPVSNLV